MKRSMCARVYRAIPTQFAQKQNYCAKRIARGKRRGPPERASRSDQKVDLVRRRATVAARVEVAVAPVRLHREIVGAELRVLQLRPRALVGVLRRCRVVPPILDGEEVVRIGDGLLVLVADDDAPRVEDPVPVAVGLRVDRMQAAALADSGPLRVLPREDRKSVV